MNRKVKCLKQNQLATAVRKILSLGGGAVVLSVSPLAIANGPFGVLVELSDLDGSDGFVLNGSVGGDEAGVSVNNAGDIDGDGVTDLIIGARYAQGSSGSQNSGESYVVFGTSNIGINGVVELSNLDGSNGFKISGVDTGDLSGRSVSGLGDINNDGTDDLIIGADLADANGSNSGESYVVFGGVSVGISGVIELSELDGVDGFVLNGVNTNDQSGLSVSGAGDVNGDGVKDLVIGAGRADPNGITEAGASYVIFGGNDLGSAGVIELSDLNGNDGFLINGIDMEDLLGSSVSGLGDVNGNGFDDLLIGAFSANPNGAFFAGESYVIFGDGNLGNSGILELSDLDGSDGFVLNGIDGGDLSGFSVSGAGDINGDGLKDLIIGAEGASPNGDVGAGESYVVFGNGNIGTSGSLNLSDLDGSDGFVINGIDAYDKSGQSVSSAGDINGDDFDDVIVGAQGAVVSGYSYYGGSYYAGLAGESYVIFGGSSVGSSGSIELSNLDGGNGFAISGIDDYDYSGTSVSEVGDINDDGLDDIIIGADKADPNGNTDAGESYVIFGKAAGPTCNGLAVTVDLNFGQVPGPDDDVVLGTPGNDDIRGRAGNDTICGEGGNDFIHGNSGNDWIDGGNGIDNLRGGQGDDEIHSGSGATAGTASIVFGGLGDDRIHGGIDADDLRGGRGTDTIYGNGGNDEITGNADDDTINGGAGDDSLRGGQGEDQLNGDDGDDSLNGGSGAMDICDGGSGTDIAAASCETIFNIP